jgi:WD40 repeat protein
VWEATTGRNRSMEGHSDWVSAVVFSPDGQLVASASNDGTVRVWEATTGHCRSMVEGPPTISHIAFSLDGQMLQTNRGDISLLLHPTTVSPILHTKRLSSVMVKNKWIVRQKRRFLWLPSDYRGCITAVHKHIICIGTFDGRLTLLSLL